MTSKHQAFITTGRAVCEKHGEHTEWRVVDKTTRRGKKQWQYPVARCRLCIREYYKSYKIRYYAISGNKKRRAEVQRRSRQLHPQSAIENRHELRMEIFHAYSDGGEPVCACCGEAYYEFLVIDHINGGGNKQKLELKTRGDGFYRWLKRNGFPPGYRVLCHNCNSALGHYGFCPHDPSEKVAIRIYGRPRLTYD